MYRSKELLAESIAQDALNDLIADVALADTVSMRDVELVPIKITDDRTRSNGNAQLIG